MMSSAGPLQHGRNRPFRHRHSRERRRVITEAADTRTANLTNSTNTTNAATILNDSPHNSPPIQTSIRRTAVSGSTNPNLRNQNRRGASARGRGDRADPATRRDGVQLTVNGQRAFGGQVTGTRFVAETTQTVAGDTTELVVDHLVVARQRSSLARSSSRGCLPKSQASGIVARIHEDITNGHYECVICTNEVLRNSRIWTCKTCWSVLHLSCVKRWCKNEVSKHQQRANENGALPPPRQWRCPGCNLPKADLPNYYTCWCAKEIEPCSMAGLPPHSCGQTCSRLRAGHCPHPCELTCHAGPCPPCTYIGTSMPCFCGKEVSSKRCVDTSYESGWSCEKVCGDLLSCGEHYCKRKCHEGLCGSCKTPIKSRCYCGREQMVLACSERDAEKESQLDGNIWVGSFDCGSKCRRIFDCGNPRHFCESTCHAQHPEPAHCPLSPDMVVFCPCGKSPLFTLLDEPRRDCSAPIPRCQERCKKLLSCGHLCQQKCHGGDCRPCNATAEVSCRCGRTTSKTACHQGVEEKPQCARVCRSILNCGRHECGDRCCPGEKKASERQASKRKHRPLNATLAIGNIEPEHICLRVCGRPLKCGNHSCSALCHKGPCSTCLEAIFDEINCACGRTVLHPPQPCGSTSPECLFDCTRSPSCGHPQTKHQCHQDTEPCPKCPFLVEKACICGKKTLKHQPCWFKEVRCGLVCGKKLRCGIHNCQKLCHRGGECEDDSGHCIQPCGRKKKVCEHACSDPCHAPYPCKEIAPCQAKILVTCVCQNRKQPIKCLASKTSPSNSANVLDCNEECLQVQRNTKLAAALKIDPVTHLDGHIPYSKKTLDFFRKDHTFAQKYERELRVFSDDPTEKRMRLKPMPTHQRAFIHSLADDFGLDSESQDPAPYRHVLIFKTPCFVASPMKTLSQCVTTKSIEGAPLRSATPLVVSVERWNAFLLVSPRFGLTVDELEFDLQSEWKGSGLLFEIFFLACGDVALRAAPSGSWGPNVEAALTSLKPSLAKKVLCLGLAANMSMCAVDGSFNVLRREETSGGNPGGWSQVVKGVSPGRRVLPASVGGTGSFTVLGGLKREDDEKEEAKGEEKKGAEPEKSWKTKENKVVSKPEDAPDDWEKEVEGWA